MAWQAFDKDKRRNPGKLSGKLPAAHSPPAKSGTQLVHNEPVLCAGDQVGGLCGVDGRIVISWPGALDRARFDPPAGWIEGQEQLRRVGHHHPVAHAPEGPVRSPPRREPDKNVERVCAGGQLASPSSRDIGLKQLSVADAGHHIGDGLPVVGFAGFGLERGGGR